MNGIDAPMVMETLGKGKILPSQILMIHWNRCNERGSEAIKQDKVADERYRCSIAQFMASLRPWQDDEFLAAKERIKKHSEPEDRIITMEEWRDLFGELICLMKRANLLPMEEGPIEALDG